MFAHADRDGRLRVKICGITNAADAEAAVELGADALGINCYRGSKRYVDIYSAAAWLRELPAAVGNVAVLVNPTLEEASAVAALSCVSALQLHGSETQAFCASLATKGIRFSKALAATNRTALAAASLFSTPTVVLDTARGAEFGGTGLTFPWALAREVADAHPELRVIVAGGLTPENIVEAIRTARPFGVDVTTGAESSPGRKDHGKMRAFIEAARSAV